MEPCAEVTVNSLPKAQKTYAKDVANTIIANGALENKEKTCTPLQSETSQLHGRVPQQEGSQTLHMAFPISEEDFRSPTPIQVSLIDGQVIHLTSRSLLSNSRRGKLYDPSACDEIVKSGQTDVEKLVNKSLHFLPSTEKPYILPQGISSEGDYLLAEEVLCEDILHSTNMLPEEQILTIPSPSPVEFTVGTKPDALAIAASEVFSNSCIGLPLQVDKGISDSIEYQISETRLNGVEEVSCEAVAGSFQPQEAHQASFSDCDGMNSFRCNVQKLKDERSKLDEMYISNKQEELGKCKKSGSLKCHEINNGKNNGFEHSGIEKSAPPKLYAALESSQNSPDESVNATCAKSTSVKNEVEVKEEEVIERLEYLQPTSMEGPSKASISYVTNQDAGMQPALKKSAYKTPVKCINKQDTGLQPASTESTCTCVETKNAGQGTLPAGGMLRRSPRAPKIKKEFIEFETSFPEEEPGPKKKRVVRGNVNRPLWDCIKCDAMFRTKASRNRHMQEGHLFRCYMCKWQGLTKTSYEVHISTIHCTQKARCLTCRKDFPNYKDYKEHMDSDHPDVTTDKLNEKDCFYGDGPNVKERDFDHEKNSAFKEEEESMYKYEPGHRSVKRLELENLQEEGKCVCPYCGKRFQRHGRFIRHINFHLGNKAFRCKLCGKCFVEKSGLKAHIMTHRPINQPCPQCGKVFKTQRTLNRHLRVHLNRRFKCTSCPKEFRHEESLRVHKTIHQEGGSGNVCAYCDKDCKTHYYLQLHMNNKHEGPKYMCKVCNRAFKWKQSYRKHMIIHNEGSDVAMKFMCVMTFPKMNTHNYKVKQEKKYPCDICGKWFQYESSRDKHRKIVHQEQLEHMCAQCGALFKAKSYLDQHILQVHTTKERVKCQTCGHDFKTESILKSHIKLVHTSTSGKYACQVCKKTFFAPKDLARHTKVHTGEKNHICPVCRRSFSRKDNMTSHLRTHSRESAEEQLQSVESTSEAAEAAKDAPESSSQESLRLLGLTPDVPSSSSVDTSNHLQPVSTPSSNIMESVSSLVSGSITFSAVPLPSISLPSTISSSLPNTVVYSNSTASSACIVLSSKTSSSTLPVVVFSGSAVSNSHVLSHSQSTLDAVSLGNLHSNMNEFPISPTSSSLPNHSSVTSLTYCNNAMVTLTPSSSNTLYTASTQQVTSTHLSLSSIMTESSSTHSECVDSVSQEPSVFSPSLHAEQMVLTEEVLASTSAISSQP